MALIQQTSHPTLAHDALIDILRLIRTPRIGPITFYSLIQRCGSASEALKHAPELARRGGKQAPLVLTTTEQVEKEIAVTHQAGAQFITYGTPDYPALLHHIQDAPPLLIAKGNIKSWQNKTCIAMVGSRNASAAGCQLAQKIAKELSQNNITVISGLARGIDSFCHRGALEHGTVGVIAGGIDTMYPPENGPLYQAMPQRGTIITEQPIHQQPFAASFPSRNRIIAGMSAGTLVVEASPKSGSLITARLCSEYDRELFAIPGSPMDPRSQGGNKLLKNGAHLVESAQDILNVIQQFPAMLEETDSLQYQGAPRKIDEAELDSIRLKLLSKLSSTPVCVDELVEQCETSAQYINSVILELELAGRVARGNGNTVCMTTSMEEVV